MRKNLQWFSLGAVGLLAAATVAQGATLTPGLYTLSNHSDGNSNPPPYGAIFKLLYDVAGDSNDLFSLDFNHPLSNMMLNYNGSTITISGQAFGGRDVGAVHAVDQYLGLYTLNFVYNVGVGFVPGDDDLQVIAPNHTNTGSIMTPIGDTINLVDEIVSGGNYSFRFGDENNDLGHRGESGISGWGWLSYDRGGTIGIETHRQPTDWLFTATRVIPAPGASVIVLTGGMLLARRRRQA